MSFKPVGWNRSNPYRAFGDAIYLSSRWTRGNPGARDIAQLMGRLAGHHVYQCYCDAGCLERDGVFKFDTGFDTFVWSAENWCRENKAQMKYKAWVQNHRKGTRTARIGNRSVTRNVLQRLSFYKMCDGLHFDFKLEGEEDAQGLLSLVEETRRDFPALKLSVVAQPSWLEWESVFDRLSARVKDIEVPLFGSGLGGKPYVDWCAQTTERFLQKVPAENLILTVPFYPPDESSPSQELLEEALQGVKQGIGFLPASVRLALYREGLGEDEDWEIYAADWAH